MDDSFKRVTIRMQNALYREFRDGVEPAALHFAHVQMLVNICLRAGLTLSEALESVSAVWQALAAGNSTSSFADPTTRPPKVN